MPGTSSSNRPAYADGVRKSWVDKVVKDWGAGECATPVVPEILQETYMIIIIYYNGRLYNTTR